MEATLLLFPVIYNYYVPIPQKVKSVKGTYWDRVR